jgi:hypothetical protein
MTGKDIVEAMSYVDEKYIDEAEHGIIAKREHLRYLLPLAACLCLILWGFRLSPTALESAQEATIAPGQALDIEIIQEHKDDSNVMQSDIALEEPMAPQSSSVPMVILRIESWIDTGFTATVVEHLDAEFVPVGTLLLVEMSPNMVVETLSGELLTAERRIPSAEEFPVGSLVRVILQSYNEEENILLIGSICKEGE